MVYYLSESELFILELLVKNRCLSRSRGFHSLKLAHLFRLKFGGSPKREIQSLRNQGYITTLAKKSPKYYISDIKATTVALEEHGIQISRGRQRKLDW